MLSVELMLLITFMHGGMVILRLQSTCWLSSYLVDLRKKDKKPVGSLLLSLTWKGEKTDSVKQHGLRNISITLHCYVNMQVSLNEKKQIRGQCCVIVWMHLNKGNTFTETGSLLSLKAWKLKQRGCWVAFLMGTKFPEHSKCNGMPSITCAWRPSITE